MKNFLIYRLANSAILNANTSLVEDYKDAYRVMKWKTQLQDAFTKLEEERQKLVKSVFTDEEVEFLSKPDAERTDELNEKLVKFNALYEEFMNDEIEVNVKPVSFESWHKLVVDAKIDFGVTENSFEGILFEAPEE